MRVTSADRERVGIVAVLRGCFFWGLAAASCLISSPVDAELPAESIVTGRIWTADDERPWAEAVAIRDTRIVAVGELADVCALKGETTRQIAVPDGTLIVPGFIDSHVHVIDGGMGLAAVELRDAGSREDFVRRIGAFARKASPGEWILRGNWDHSLWGGELPTRHWIDGVTDDQPVWIQRLDGHMALANSAALRAAGVSRDTPDVPGGTIVREADGTPSGIFKDNAMELIANAVPEPTAAQLDRALAAATKYFASCGVTSVHHMGSWSDLAVFRRARAAGKLSTRIYAAVPLSTWKRLAADRAARDDDVWLRTGGLKGFVDGSLGSHTAAMLEPFSDTPQDRGLLVNSTEQLYEWVRDADRAGLQVMVHAIGDRANRNQLDVFERVAAENGPRDRRFRIEHAQHIAPTDLDRFALLGVLASMQPYHAIDDGRWAEAGDRPGARRHTLFVLCWIDG